MTRGRYRWRTAVRMRTPWWLIERGVAAKGRRDCGDHDFFNADGVVERCYHCQVGERPHDPAHVRGHRSSRAGDGD
ncbi:hypothetical protein [Quadrisphaera setariae]|uniref:Uncharacterized protein n=1 Tax=Quadrisphaera setariae TaxID=2593304 RepID=A0A5C8ZJ43_9ACTN|nr:hypothetical protein [Quadrisphaera setariae]TXR57624.1 hypothetical protein FMM08_05295 [Quadrisphaera setariae]